MIWNADSFYPGSRGTKITETGSVVKKILGPSARNLLRVLPLPTYVSNEEVCTLKNVCR